MKKLFVCLVLCALLLASFGAAAFAQPQYVDNSAGLLSSEEQGRLEEACRQVSEYYGCGVYVALVDDYRAFSGRSVADAAEAYYTQNGLGMDQDNTGIMLMLSMNDRDYYILCHGNKANTAFTDYGKDLLEDVFLDNFRQNDWYGGLAEFVDSCAQFMDYAAKGDPIDTYVYDEPERQPMSTGTKLTLAALPSSLIALISCSGMKAKMKTTGRKTEANQYVDGRGVVMHVVQDQFTHRTQSVQVIQQNTAQRAPGGRPGGTTINSGGFSGRGGKF